MKKTITILLLTALCMIVLTSCDFSGGLVGDLLEGLAQENVDVDPVVDVLETDVDVMPIEPSPIETTPVTDVPVVLVVGSKTYHFSMQYSNDRFSGYYDIDLSELSNALGMDGHIVYLEVGGTIGFVGTDSAEFGYSINGEQPIWVEDWQRDPDADLKEEYTSLGAEYVTGYKIRIDMDDLPDDANYTITLLYRVGDTQGEFCTFETCKYVENKEVNTECG
ncbi:MAG: hypothetical protein IIW17_01565 [Clostridia bacterium]|jgi:hypothetical protein|nr:hypothetical protein [Clostridia bacterium]MBQ5792686.1 hypothetical protein [Clostridia bacterium]